MIHRPANVRNAVEEQVYNIELANYRIANLIRGTRPVRDPKNLYTWNRWMETLTEEEQHAERVLLQSSYYKYEGVFTMSECVCSEGTQLYEHDLVRLTQDVEDVKAGTNGEIVTIYAETEVLVNPHNAGLPVIVNPNILTVVCSFGKKWSEFNVAEFEAIIEGVHAKAEVNLESRSKGKTRSKKPKKEDDSDVIMEIEL